MVRIKGSGKVLMYLCNMGFRPASSIVGTVVVVVDLFMWVCVRVSVTKVRTDGEENEIIKNETKKKERELVNFGRSFVDRCLCLNRLYVATNNQFFFYRK